MAPCLKSGCQDVTGPIPSVFLDKCKSTNSAAKIGSKFNNPTLGSKLPYCSNYQLTINRLRFFWAPARNYFSPHPVHLNRAPRLPLLRLASLASSGHCGVSAPTTGATAQHKFLRITQRIPIIHTIPNHPARMVPS